MRTNAHRLARLAASVVGPIDLPLRAWDGSTWTPAAAAEDDPVLVVSHRRALRRLIRSPGELGLAEAYISGDLDVDGDLSQALARLWQPGDGQRHRIPLRRRPALAAQAVRLGAVGPMPRRPGAAATLRGRRHSPERDRAAIAHHYDVGNEFYELLLDQSMAYSCGYFADGPTGSLADAQTAKLDLICRKLGLTEGSTHLDIGCGWGALICHAAEHYGTRSVGVTLSGQQHDYVSKRVAAAGLADRVTVIRADYRELAGGRYGTAFDAVSTIEMGEHVGEQEYPAFAALLHDLVRPGGRVLVQQMSRGTNAPAGGAFIETYIAPDMHMKPLGRTAIHLAAGGLEIRDVQALREHYVWTIEGWADALEQQWGRAVELLGETGARIWRLYLAGSALAFATGRMGVDQILSVRPHPDGRSTLPAGRSGWEPR